MALAFKERFRNEPPPEFRACANYDIVPSIAFIHGTPVYSLAASWGMRYIFTGGEDGFVRKYDFQASINSAQLLTASQRHMLLDTVTKCGVLSAYWENEQPLLREEYEIGKDNTYIPRVSPVFSLAAQAEALWVAAGLESGGISLQSATYGEMGQVLAYLDGHTKAVSDLQLNGPETLLLSGSWDKSVMLWDLNSGSPLQKYSDLGSQVSCVAWQPLGGTTVVPPTIEDKEVPDDDDKSMESLFGSEDESEEARKQGEVDGKVENKSKEASGGDDSGSDGKNDSGSGSRAVDAGEGSDAGGSNNTDADDARACNTGNVFLSASYNGLVEIWDQRQATRAAWLAGSGSPPWCTSACFSYDGNRAFAGRRNACVEEYDLRQCNAPARTLKFPSISGAVSCVTPMPNNRSLLCASFDNIRMYDLESTKKTPFYIIPGHHGALVSRLLVDHSGKYLISACGGRGWVDSSSDVTLGYDISPE